MGRLRDILLGRPRRGRWTLARRLLQLLVLALFTTQVALNGEVIKGSLASSRILDGLIPGIGAIMMLDPWAWIEHAVATLSPALDSLIPLATVLILYFVFLGRFFCGWVCPVDMLFSLFERKLNLPRNPPGSRYHPPTRSEKLVPALMMLVYIVLSVALAYPFYTTISPIAAATRAGSLLVAMLYGIPGATVALIASQLILLGVALAVNLVGEYVFGVKRLWCRYVCPVGNLYGLVANRYSPLRVKLAHPEKCTRCRLCSLACPMTIDLVYWFDRGMDVLDHRCLHCGRCVEVCPTKAISLSFRRWGAKGPGTPPPQPRRPAAAAQ